MQQGTKVYYLDQVVLKDIVGNRTISSKVRGIIAPGTTGALPIRPVLFLHTPPSDRNSYHLILLNFSTGQVLVLDPRTGETENSAYASWDCWGGIRIWKILADAFGWMDQDDIPRVREIDWVKVCGLEKHCLINIHIIPTPV